MGVDAMALGVAAETFEPVQHRDEEAELVARLTAGDADAFRGLFRAHAPDLFRLARRFVHSDAEAEEVVQEVFIATYEHIDRFRGQARIRTWLYRVTVNRALKRRRWWSRRREVPPDPIREMVQKSPGPETLAGDREALRVLQGCLDKLDTKKRAVLVLHELEGLDTRQIAEILDCPRSTVLTRLARARAELIRHARRAGLTLRGEEE